MEKQRRWQLCLIVAVLVLTLYNILPTLFYYSKPLGSSIDDGRAKNVAEEIVTRVNQMEVDAKEWLHAFSRLLRVKPASIESVPGNSSLFKVSFENEVDAQLFQRFLPKAGALISFVPSQLELGPNFIGADTVSADQQNLHPVFVQRNLAFTLDPQQLSQMFQFAWKQDAEHQPTALYRQLIYDRAASISLAIGGASQSGLELETLRRSTGVDDLQDEKILKLAQEIREVGTVIGEDQPLAYRYYSYFAQVPGADRKELVEQFVNKAEELKKRLQAKRDISAKKQKVEDVLDPAEEQTLALIDQQIQSINSALGLMRHYSVRFNEGRAAFSLEKAAELLAKDSSQVDVQVVDLAGLNPFIQGIEINWVSNRIVLKIYPDVDRVLKGDAGGQLLSGSKNKLQQVLFNDIARISRIAEENFKPGDETFYVELDRLGNAKSYLIFDLAYLARERAAQIHDQLSWGWNPTHSDFTESAYPIYSYSNFESLSAENKRLGLVVYAPAAEKNSPLPSFRNGSIYVIAKGMAAILDKYKEAPDTEESKLLAADFQRLNEVLQKLGFIGYPASSFSLPKEFSRDYIFELDDFYSTFIKATREEFQVRGSKRYAVLDFSDVEQRILAWNKIEDRMQEDLLKWKEAYQAAQVDLNVTSHYTVPPPTKSPFWENLKLSTVKYFSGDDRKILKWGLDLSGGKSVRIGLLDSNGKSVTDPDDMKQAVNELYTRINKMGVAERTIRVENSTILLDFPGSQNLSAAELVKASAMYFHIVNEKFGPFNASLASVVHQFLQEVWNEAVVTNRKEVESINEIAWQHLGGDPNGLETVLPMSDSAKQLYEAGLRLSNPKNRAVSQQFDDTFSSVALFKGSDTSEWDQQTHPLLIVFNNYALEGANLENIQAGYEPAQGNILSFGVKSSYDGDQETGSPRDTFYAWTSQFSEEKIAGTPKEVLSRGKGWRMAVILNGAIITSPTLNAALREGGTISGRFSQREVAQLAADLKAGSMSFTPKILSEQNVSPELGQEERVRGIAASTVALVLVVVAMIGYYRFAGLVASCAVLLNIFIMWGILQNIGAALTLPGIAGIVLTIGMAVDANVLVFERFREEFKISKRIGAAIQAAYRKAFSAIIDSNVTTIIAALILIQFDSGPIKGFAVTLIIGILSSMFTALFMTRYFFAGWVRNPEHKRLEMMQFLHETHFDFLKQARKALIISLLVMLAGTYFFIEERKTLFGMDFTGGYSLTVDLAEKNPAPDYRIQAMNAFLEKGASRRDIEVRELSRPNHLRIQLGTSMDERNHPFYQMPEVESEGRYGYEYQRDPRLNWVVETLKSNGLDISSSQLPNLQKNWTVMSGQFSDAMRNNAVVALVAALLFILIYITFRFEFKYAIGAVAGLVHDVFITLGILALFHALGFPVQIDLQVIGAIMTIIGYSLNDTIIVFDRIREDVKLMRRVSFKEVINHALNVTLSRTIMTSGTTLLVLLALVLLGGEAIFGFSLVMTVGVLVGTFSSLFIASPVMLYFHDKEMALESVEGRNRAHP